MGIRVIRTTRPLRDPAVLAVRNVLRAGGLTAAGEGRADIPSVVGRIIADVQARGDAAFVDWTRRLHKLRLTPRTLFVPAGRIRAARAAMDKPFLSLVRRAAGNIRAYQRRILVTAPTPLRRAGRTLGVRYTPMDRVAVYVPGGKAAYPSTLLMTVVPAQVAGVGEIVLATPPGPDGAASLCVLALAGELGVQKVLCAAGVAALAALAIGTKTIPPVDKIVGPGSAYIAEAKRQLFGRVGIDSITGPSEVLIVADDSARPDWLAADMLAQAKHDPGSAVLVTTSAKLAQAVAREIERQLPLLSRRSALDKALAEYSAIIVVPDLKAACDVANDFAPEHLQIVVRREREALARIRHAGAIFVGAYSPVPLGDYYAGPSHVLPTGGAARFSSALSANDFLKATSVIQYDEKALAADADDVICFARREGLSAHARAAEIRRK